MRLTTLALAALASSFALPAAAQTAPEAMGFMMTFASERLSPGTKLESASDEQARWTYTGPGHRQTIVATKKGACTYELEEKQVADPGSQHKDFLVRYSIYLTNADWMKATTENNSIVGRYVDIPGAKMCFLTDGPIRGFMNATKGNCSNLRTVVPINHIMAAYQILSQSCKPRAF